MNFFLEVIKMAGLFVLVIIGLYILMNLEWWIHSVRRQWRERGR